MGAPIGNKNSKGNKGGRRKSAYQERADAELLWRMYTEPLSKSELTKLLRSGKYSIKDVMVMKAHSGNETLIKEIFKKLFPDNLNIQANIKQRSMEQIENDVREILGSIKKNAKSKRS